MKTHQWKQESNLYLWRYVPENKNYSGWHLTGDKQGIGSLVKLLQALKSDGTDQLRTLNLSVPSESEYRIPGCKSKPVSVNKLKVSYSPAGFSGLEILQQEGNTVMFISHSNVDQYSQAFLGLLGGTNDFQIGNSSNGIWLW